MLNIFKKGLQTAFFEAFDAVTPEYTNIATVVNSTGPSEDYAWLSALPGVREMRGERIPRQLADYGFTLKNKEYEASVAVKRSDIKDDQTGKYGPLVRQIGENARLFPDELIFGTLLPNGFTTVAYDGQYFFDVDHSAGASGNQSNKLTAALAAASLDTAYAMLRTLKDDQARPINFNFDLRLIVPAQLWSVANGLVNVPTLAAGGANPQYGLAKVIVSPWLTDTDNWYLVNVAGQIKPFIWQEREFIPLETLEEGSETDFMRKEQYFGTYLRGNAGYGLWQKAVGSLV